MTNTNTNNNKKNTGNNKFTNQWVSMKSIKEIHKII